MNQGLVNAQPAVVTPLSEERRIGQILLDSGKITAQDAERILRLQKEQGLLFGDAAKKLGLVSEADIQEVLSLQFDYPYLVEGQGKLSDDLVAAYQPFNPQVEALRTLRTQLMLRWFGPEQKALAVISAERGEGRSYVAGNLAVVFSQLGERTLLIDADLRHPRQREMFSIPPGKGLSDILAGKASEEVISRVPVFSDLCVLPAGTLAPNPQELLNRPQFSQLLGGLLAQRYDVVLLDTSAGMLTADAQTVAAGAGGALVVARQDVTRLSAANRLSTVIANAGSKIIGAVLNKF